MEQHEKRHALRVICSIGLQLQGEWTHVQARVEDVGRLGARLRVSIRELGLESHEGLTGIAAHIRQLLTHDVVAQFRPEMLGSLVQRHVHALRIAHVEAGDEFVDVGCEFDRPLTPQDVAALGLPIPMDGQSVEEAEAGVEGKAPQAREPSTAAGAIAGGNAYADLRWALLVRKSDLGAGPGNGSSDPHCA